MKPIMKRIWPPKPGDSDPHLRFHLPVEQKTAPPGDETYTLVTTVEPSIGEAMDTHRRTIEKVIRSCVRPTDEEYILWWRQWPAARGPLSTPEGWRWEITSWHALVRKAYADKKGAE